MGHRVNELQMAFRKEELGLVEAACESKILHYCERDRKKVVGGTRLLMNVTLPGLNESSD